MMKRSTSTLFSIQPLSADDETWLRSYINDHWGAEEVVVHETIYRPAALQGFAGECNGILLGVITYLIQNGQCEIVTLNADPLHTGLGSALLEKVEVEAAKQGCSRCWLVTTNDNLDGLRFYQRRGYRMAAIHRGAVTAARKIKPSIPLVGDYGIVLQDEIMLEKPIECDPDHEI